MTEHIRELSRRATDPLLAFDLEEPDVLSSPHQIDRPRETDAQVGNIALPGTAPTFVIGAPYDSWVHPIDAPRHLTDPAALMPKPEPLRPKAQAQNSSESGSPIGRRVMGSRRQATLLAQRYSKAAVSRLFNGCRAFLSAVGQLAGHLGARGVLISARTITLTRRENPVSFALVSYGSVAAVMFLLGRLSGLPDPVKPLVEMSPVVTALESAAAAPSAFEARSSSAPLPAIAPPRAPDVARPVTLQAAMVPRTESPGQTPPPAASPGAPFRGSLAVARHREEPRCSSTVSPLAPRRCRCKVFESDPGPCVSSWMGMNRGSPRFRSSPINGPGRSRS